MTKTTAHIGHAKTRHIVIDGTTSQVLCRGNGGVHLSRFSTDDEPTCKGCLKAEAREIDYAAAALDTENEPLGPVVSINGVEMGGEMVTVGQNIDENVPTEKPLGTVKVNLNATLEIDLDAYEREYGQRLTKAEMREEVAGAMHLLTEAGVLFARGDIAKVVRTY